MTEKDTKSTAKAKTTAKTETTKTKATAKPDAVGTAKSTAKSASTAKAAKPETKTAAKPSPKATAKTAAKPVKEAPAKEAPAASKNAAKKPAEKPAAPAKEKTAKSDGKPAKSSGKPSNANESKAVDKKPAKSGSSSGGAAIAALSPQKLRAIIISAVSVLLVVIIIISVVLGTKSCNRGVDPYHYSYGRFNDDANYMIKEYDDSNWDGVLATALTDGVEKGTSRAPQTSEYLGTVTPVKPVKGVFDEHEIYGVSQYPYYGRNLTGYTVSERDGLFEEGHALAPSPTWNSLGIYNGIDSEGYLIKDGVRVTYDSTVTDPGEAEEGEGENISGGIEEEEGEELETGSTSVNNQYKATYRMLYEHTASLTMYGMTAGLPKEEPRIIKQITFVNQSKVDSSQITGLYAPAGEVIKIEMSKSDYNAAGGLIVVIGQSYNLWQHVSMEKSGDGIKGTGLCRMPDIVSRFQLDDRSKNVTVEGDKVTAYVGSFLGGPIYIRPVNNQGSRGVRYEQELSVTISGGVRYQHFILGATTEEEYNLNKASTAPYFDLEIYDSVRFTTHKYASTNGKALKDYSYQDCTDSAILWDKISQVSKRVAWNGLSSASSQVNIIGDCYVAAGAAFANPGRNGVVCPPSWLPDALQYDKFVNGGSWGTMHEYNHCWQGYGLGNSGEVSNNATTLVAYTLYTRISQARTLTGGVGGWNRFTDPAHSLNELLTNSAKGGKIYDLSAYATLIHGIGQDSFVAAARGGKEGGSTVFYNNLVNASHYDMTYYFTDILNYNIGGETKTIGSVTQAAVETAKSQNYPMFVPVSSVYQVGRSIIYDNEKRYITTAQPFSYGSGEYIMDFNNHNGNGSYGSKNLVIPDGFTVSVVSVTQPANGKVEMLGDNYVKYTPKNGEDGLYSGNFRVKLRIIKNDRAFIVEDVDLVINLKQSESSQLYRTTYVYETAADVPDTEAVYNAQTKAFDFGTYASTETKINVCSQESNTQIWAAGWNYDDDTYIKGSTNYRVQPINLTLQTMEGALYFEKAGDYRITLKGRGKATLYLSYDNGVNWEKALTISRTSGNAYNDSEYSAHKFTTANNYVRFRVVLLVTNISDFFGVGAAKQNADGTYPAFGNTSAIASSDIDIHKASVEDRAKKFETEYHYKTEYRYAFTGSIASDVTQNTLISVSHEPWDNTRLIDFLFDGRSDTYYHSKKGTTVSEASPFELVVDLGSLQNVNSVTFNGYTGNTSNNGMVKTFKLYGSTDNSNYFLLTEKANNPTGTKVFVSFKDAEIRYYKLVVTDTYSGNHYFAMNSILFSYTLSAGTGSLTAPNEPRIRYVGDNWTANSSFSTFGITYMGNVGDSVEYHFNGSRVAYFANNLSDYGTVDIYLDGRLVAENITIGNNTGMTVTQEYKNQYGENVFNATGSLVYLYMGEALSDGEHILKVVGKSGKFSVEAFAYWA